MKMRINNTCFNDRMYSYYYGSALLLTIRSLSGNQIILSKFMRRRQDKYHHADTKGETQKTKIQKNVNPTSLRHRPMKRFIFLL